MSYILQGVLGSAPVLAPAKDFRNSRVIALNQGVCLLPVGRDLFDELSAGEPMDPGFTPCQLFPPGFEHLLARWSGIGPTAYVEADYFGGVGTQFAAVWRGGVLVFGPVLQPEGAPFSATDGSLISQALRLLGVSRERHVDEFDAVGLGRYRDVDDWLRYA